MKWVKVLLIIVVSLIALIFWVCHSMTPAPGSISGNGNPVFIFTLPMLGLFSLLIVLWGRIFRAHRVSQRFVFMSSVVAVFYMIIGFIYQRIALNQYKQVIYEAILKEDEQVDPVYFEQITSGLSIHINNQNFNVNTFLISMCVSLLLALYLYWSGGRTKKNSEM